MDNMTKGAGTINAWHRFIRSKDIQELDEILADEVTFHSPVVHSVQRGKAITRMYLAAALDVLGNDTFRYVREVMNEQDAVLEFEVEVKGVVMNGVDMIRWNDQGKIIDFKVMVRPLKAINLIHQEMASRLARK
jgi:hypothetical protein